MRNTIIMKKKLFIGNTIMYILFMVIIGRLFYLQVINHNYYLEKLLSRNNKIVYENTSLRGRIYDRNNELLVDNKLVLAIIYRKEKGISTLEEIKLAYDISKRIKLDYQKLTKSYLKDFYILEHDLELEKKMDQLIKDKLKKRLITANDYYKIKKDLVTDDDLNIYDEVDKQAIYLYYLMNNGYSYTEKIIKENCSMEEFMYFSESAHNLHGFNTKYMYGRVYLHGDTFRSILGNVGSITSESKDYYLSRGYNINDKVGLSNLEFMYDEYLRGKPAMYLLKDNEKILLKETVRGNDLKLTIDIKLQKYVDSILEKEVVRAKEHYNTKHYNHSYLLISNTMGEVLSMNGKEIIHGKVLDNPIGNISDTITPGSVVKGASMIVGYDTGAIKVGEVIKDECIKIKATPKKCSVYTMGYLNDINALAFSSNVYQFKTAIKVGGGVYRYNESVKINPLAFSIYRDYFQRFGLGVNTGIDLPNESRGYKGERRDAGLLLNYAIGQYDTYTNIQLNQYISTIAQDGKRYKMYLVKEISDNDNIIFKKEANLLNEVNVPLEYIKRVQEGFKAVISYGSGKGYTNISSSGKTGTSESFYDSDFDGRIDTETISTNFVMYAPSVNPKFAISITSPNISTPSSGYKYPINKIVIQNITKNIYNYIK